jgi:hypothetical protein
LEAALLSALHTITEYPLDLSAPVFDRYPFMKFGDRQSVDRFAELLAPLARRMILETEPLCREWVLTAPPREGLTCGAALVSGALHRVLSQSLPGEIRLHLDTFCINTVRPPIENHDEFVRLNEYSKLDFQTRLAIRVERDSDARYNLDIFRGRGVIFVNDINVTGAQMASVDGVLRKAGPARIDWLFIVDVDRDIGRAHPHLESEINNSKLATIEELIAYLQRNDYQCTGRLTARLLSYDLRGLARILAALTPHQRKDIYEGIRLEGMYDGAYFAEKVKVVERFAHGERAELQGDVA